MSQKNNLPQTISRSEWAELSAHPLVREAWQLTNETADEVARFVYGVKFDFVSGSPGYYGELYILKGDFINALR